MGVVRAGNFKTVGLSNAQIVDGSLKFDSTKTQHLKRTPSSTGNRRTWTFSCWYRALKRGTGANGYRAFFGSLNTYINHSGAGGGATEDDLYWNLRDAGTNYFGEFAELFRDPGAWYHIVWSVDTTQSTSSNRAKLYVNNVALGAAGAGPNGISYPPQSTETPVNAASNVHYIGANDGASNPMEGQLTQVYLIDGYALDPSYFGFTDPLTNTWRPKKYKTSIDTYVNNGTVWSNSWGATGSTGNVDNGANAFNGNLSNYASNQNSNTTVVWQPSSPIPVRRTLRVYAAAISSGSGQVAVNGTDLGTIPSSTPQWWTIRGATQLEKISLTDTGSTHGRLYAVEVDGVILVNSSTSNSLVDNYFFGTNGFYLPFDGNSLIGQDQSGRGSDWTPVNFGGSNTIEKATGAFPILNTDGGGKVARVGVRTDSNASSLVLALPLVGIKSDFSNAVNSGTSNKAVTENGGISGSSVQSNFYGGSYLFDGSNDYITVTGSSDTALGTGDFTIEGWFKLEGTGSNQYLVFQSISGGAGNFLFYRGSATALAFYSSTVGGTWDTISDLSMGSASNTQWVHLAVTRQSGTVRTWNNGVLISSQSGVTANLNNTGNVILGTNSGATGQFFNGYIQDFRIYKGVAKYTQNFIPASTDPDILPDTPSGVAYSSNVSLVPSTDGAVAFQGTSPASAATNYLNAGTSSDFTVGTNGNFTFEAFINPTSVSDTSVFSIGASTTFAYRIISGSPYLYIQTTGGILNTGTIAANKWTHIAVTRNGGTLYSFIDGVLVGSVANTGSFDAATGTGAGTFIGAANLTVVSPPNYSFTGQISNLHWVNGTALYTSNFTPPTGPITSVANTKLLCCKSNSSATVADVSPTTITATGSPTPTNFNPFTVNINTQRGQESGYCTLNPLDLADFTLSNGNLNYSKTSTTWKSVRATQGVNSGKWYYEFQFGSDNRHYIGISQSSMAIANYPGATSTSYSIYLNNGYKSNNGSDSAYASAFASTDVLGVAFDLDASTITFYKNGISLGVAFTSIASGYYFPTFGTYASGENGYVNFGQKPFKFPPPTGFQPLALANTPRPTIVRPDQYVGVATYSGNGVSGRKVSGYNFKPDLIWIKRRDSTAGHIIQDTIRGSSVYLGSDSTAGDSSTGGSGSSSAAVQFFDSDGFTLGTGAGVNASGGTYVGWCWKAGGNSNTFNINDIGYSTASAAGLTAGTITPTGASVNTKSGFSIIRYTGTGSAATVSHGLQNTPQFLIVKRTDTTERYWMVYHTSTGNTNRLVLNDTFAVSANSLWWNNTSPTSSVFSLGADPGNFSNSTNASGGTYIAYLWAEIPGFSKFGSYTGNSSSDGPVVVTGFRPRWILIKCSSSDQSGNAHWLLFDGERNKFNVSSNVILGNLSDREYTASDGVVGIDILSNGFKIRDNNTSRNGSGTYIYAAFAETPSFNLYGGQSNAR